MTADQPSQRTVGVERARTAFLSRRPSRSWIAVAATLALGSLFVVTSERSGAVASVPVRPLPAEVPVAAVVVESLPQHVEVVGTIAAVETVRMQARVAGMLEHVAFTEGGLVNEGDLLFRLDDEPFRATLSRVTAEAARAAEAARLAELEYDRARRLVETESVSRAVYDRATARRAQAHATLAAARAEVRTAELDLSYTRIASPITGRVGQALVRPGNLIVPGASGTLLTTVVSTDPVHVHFVIDEPTFRLLSVASDPADVVVSIAGDATARTARLDFLDNALDPSTGSARARAVLRGVDLRPGLFARVRIPVTEPRETLLVSDHVVRTGQSGRFVIVLGDSNTLETRPVEIGGLADGLRVIRSGLRPGDRVALAATAQPGMVVTPKAEPMLAKIGGLP